MKPSWVSCTKHSGAAWLAAVLLFPVLAAAQSGEQPRIIDRVGTVLDGVARGLNYVGGKAQDLVGPGLGFGKSDAGGFLESRDFAERYPVGPAAVLTMANEFGQIRIGSWDNRIVQVTAKISVRAESGELASEIARNIDIHVTPGENSIDVRTILPDTRKELGKPAIEVNYEVTIPTDASVVCRNDFGDTAIAGAGGSVAVDARYGAVDLRDIAGGVNVRARGEFAVTATGLRQGGTFELHGARGEFRDVSGFLKISGFRGSVDLRDLAPEVNVDLMSESTAVALSVAEASPPDVSATVLFGDVQSDLPLDRTSQGDAIVARMAHPESKQRVVLHASFANIVIQRQGSERSAEPAAAAQPNQPFKEVLTQTESILQNAQIVVDAIPGDVRVTGADQEQVRITATKFVRLQSQTNVRAALQALDVRISPTEGTLTIRTAVTDNMAALGCVSYRVDLAIECPRTVNLDVRAEDGHTIVSGLGGNAVVKQAAGAITVEHVKGAVNLDNQKGEVTVTSCAGPAEVSTAYGALNLNEVYGKITAACFQGKTVIESPRGEVSAHSSGGDIRIIALDGVAGNYDVHVEQGNISILVQPEVDASLSVTAENGAVYSGIPLTGSIKKDFQEFVKNGSGPFRVTLQTKAGDIFVN